MNWKLILQLSLLGLVMAFGTVSLIPGTIESFFWITLFIICSYIIAKQCTGRYFLHGFVLSLFNCVWITIAHVGFYTTYVANHPNMATMGASMHILTAPPKIIDDYSFSNIWSGVWIIPGAFRLFSIQNR